jgi:thiamine monophosphate kinase
MDITGKLVVAAVTHTETRIWATDAHRGDKPEVVAAALAPAGQILLVGHGKGKSNSMLKLIQHLERHQPKTAEKVVAALDVNVPALTEPQILAAAREWFDDHKNG